MIKDTARIFVAVLMTGLLWQTAVAFVVVDSLTRRPLGGASVFDRNGRMLGVGKSDGKVTCASPADYPVTVRYMGFKEKTVKSAGTDTVFMEENVLELPEVVFEGKEKKLLHILAYMREYSTLSSYTDTVSMFREKMVDFMLPDAGEKSGPEWREPRVLNSRSYYRFTDVNGLDSVSDRCNQHFTWSDWIGILPEMEIPMTLVGKEYATDTVHGKYTPAEIWRKSGDRLTVDVDLVGNPGSRRWVPGMSAFLGNDNIDFELFGLRLNYDNVSTGRIGPLDLTGYSFNIESRGRGHGMFQFNRYDRPFFVSTYTEVYILDKEFITVKEARKWDKRQFDTSAIEIYEPMEAPELQPSVLALIDRVNGLDTEAVRLSLQPDQRLKSRNVSRRNFMIGYRALAVLKQVTGITYLRSHRKFDKNWRNFRREQYERNQEK